MKKQTKQLYVMIASLVGVIALCLISWHSSSLSSKDDSHSFAVYITEVLASNNLYPDNLGHNHDFIEIYNSANGEIDISGYKLTDSQRNIGYEFPAGTYIKPGEYLVVWCEANTDEPIANFSISKSGGEIIYLMNRKNVIIDTVNTLPTKRNMPMVLASDGNWTLQSYATPGFPNTQQGYDAYLKSKHASNFPVLINEVLASNTRYPSPDGVCYDFVELYNTSESDVDLSGCRLSDTPDKVKYYFAEGTIIPAKGYLLLWCDDNTGLPFKISSQGTDSIIFQSPSGDVIDEVTVPALDDNCSYARMEDLEFTVTDLVTPGFVNDASGLESYFQSNTQKETMIFINEVMSDNKSTFLGVQGFPDWVEIANMGNTEVDLQGWWLSDDENNLKKWSFPECVIGPGEQAVILCDKNISYADTGFLYADLSFSSSGETVCLSNPSGLLVDRMNFGNSEPDVSFVPSTTDQGAKTMMVTPGFPNTYAGFDEYQSTLTMPFDLAISEVMTANDQYLQQPNNKYYDWVELYNNSSSSIQLSDYYLTDSLNDLHRLQLPDISLDPGEYYVSVLDTGDLSLNAKEDWIYLIDSNDLILDQMHLKDIPYQSSIGRTPSFGGTYYYSTPTPETENGMGSSLVSASPTADVSPGIYNNVDSLTVCLSGQGTIHYTTDGSWPTEEDEVYTVPFELTKSTVIRAICVEEGLMKSQTVTLGYFINENHTLPIVSLNCDPSDLYGSNGIITHVYSDWEKHANLSFYDLDGSSFELDCGVTLFGSLSRETNMKKSFKCIFRPRYGQGMLEYPLYDDSYENQFYSLVIRNSQDYPLAFIREEVMTSLAQDCSDSLQTTRSRYVCLYLNGEYYGISALKEAFSSEYYATHHGFPEETCKCVRVINVLQDAPELYQLMLFCVKNDLTDPDNYAYVTSMVDIDSLIDWIIFETYCANTDILNNVRYLHSSVDGKWRWAFYDLDWSMSGHGGLVNGPLDPDEQFFMIPGGLLQNSDFRDRFLTRYAELLSTTLSDQNVTERIESLSESIRAEMPRERELWGGSMDGWDFRLGELRSFVNRDQGRAAELIYDVCNYFSLRSDEREYYFGGILDE